MRPLLFSGTDDSASVDTRNPKQPLVLPQSPALSGNKLERIPYISSPLGFRFKFNTLVTGGAQSLKFGVLTYLLFLKSVADPL